MSVAGPFTACPWFWMASSASAPKAFGLLLVVTEFHVVLFVRNAAARFAWL